MSTSHDDTVCCGFGILEQPDELVVEVIDDSPVTVQVIKEYNENCPFDR